MKKLFILGIMLINTTIVNATSYTPLTLPTLSADIRTWTYGKEYSPIFPSSQTFAGVPFNLQLDSSGNNMLCGVAPCSKGQQIINVGVNNVTTVYTLINTGYGSKNANVGSLTFTGSSGAIYTVPLIVGYNVRDHYYGSFVNTTTAPYVTQAVFGVNTKGHAHLDMQRFTLPVDFQNQKLIKIKFNSKASSLGNPFIVGITIATGENIGGQLTGMNANKGGTANCINLRTLQQVTVEIPNGKNTKSWDCSALGLSVNIGDEIKQTIDINGSAF
jgi:hypothetical protein